MVNTDISCVSLTGNTPQHLVIRASAGTGKTFQLSSRYLGLLAAGVPVDTILAATFTRKAAGEILTRILRRLADAACDPNACDALAQTLLIPQNAYQTNTTASVSNTLMATSSGIQPLTTERCQELLAVMIRNLHRLRIGTLDSLFQQIAGNFSLELGLPPGWSIVEQGAIADHWLHIEAIRRLLDDPTAAQTLMHRLTRGEATRRITPQILEVVAQFDTIARESLPESWEICPEKQPLSEEIREKYLKTLECSASLVPDKRMAAAAMKAAAIFRKQAWSEFLDYSIVKKSVGPQVDALYYKKEIPGEIVDACAKLAQHALAILLHQIRQQTQATRQLLDRFRELFDPLQDADRLYRFADIPRKIGEIQMNPHSVGFRLDAPIDHLLLDEFQDTSPLQWSILRPIARRIVESPHGSFFCVGDRKQAIYGWRGGVAAIFDRVQSDLEQTSLAAPAAGTNEVPTGRVSRPHIEQQDLNCCWRCSPIVLEVVNQVFEHLPENSVVQNVSSEAATSFSERFTAHVAAPKNATLPGYVQLIASSAPKKINNRISVRSETETVVRDAAQKIQQMLRDAPGASVGVLVRRNEVVGRMIYELRQLGLPASEEGGNPLTDSPAVEVVLSMLTLVDHPGDRVAAFHVASSPLGAIVGILDHNATETIHQVTQEIRERLAAEHLGDVLYEWKTRLETVCEPRDIQRLAQLVETAMQYDLTIGAELRSPRSTHIETGLRCDHFVQEVRRLRIDSPGDAPIRVMTIHQAKGLEFDIVVLAELNGTQSLVGQSPRVLTELKKPTDPVTGVVRYLPKELLELFPELDRIRQIYRAHLQRQVEESLSLLYVAMTRAVHALYMIVPPTAESQSKKKSDDTEVKLSQNFGSVLRAALAKHNAKAGEVLFEYGNPQWFLQMPDKRNPCHANVGLADVTADAPIPHGNDLCTANLDTEHSIAVANSANDLPPPAFMVGCPAPRRSRLLDPRPDSPRFFGMISPSSLEGYSYAEFQTVSPLSDTVDTHSDMVHREPRRLRTAEPEMGDFVSLDEKSNQVDFSELGFDPFDTVGMSDGDTNAADVWNGVWEEPEISVLDAPLQWREFSDGPAMPPINIAMEIPPDAASMKNISFTETASSTETAQAIPPGETMDALFDESLRMAQRYGRRRGTLVHQWFEQIGIREYGQDSSESLAPSEYLPRTAEELEQQIGHLVVPLGIPVEEIRQMKADFLRILQVPQMRAALRKPSVEEFCARHGVRVSAETHLEVRREMPFAVRMTASKMIFGIIDRITMLWQGNRCVAAEILDYKTDRLPANAPEMLSERIAFYRPQIAAYARSIAKMYHVPYSRLSMRLLFTTLPHLADLPSFLSAIPPAA
ncbi:MAG: UvrD-helicase domain-containing protein [Thermoguttaceae bacterium]|nr:UvrD-helicase domain-containing protein [Thermoguttaceae bacterium]